MRLNGIPWGRDLNAYRSMFDLTPELLKGSLLDIASGISSFNSEVREQALRVVSCDPIYHQSPDELMHECVGASEQLGTYLRQKQNHDRWQLSDTPEALANHSERVMHAFMLDYRKNYGGGYYLPLSLPHLPFSDGEFDIALCSHFLFRCGEDYATVFHVDAICEMARVAKEARIFPLTSHHGELSSVLDATIMGLQSRNLVVEIREVSYQLQAGSNAMLCARAIGSEWSPV